MGHGRKIEVFFVRGLVHRGKPMCLYAVNKWRDASCKTPDIIDWFELFAYFRNRHLVDKSVDKNSLLDAGRMIEWLQFIERTETGEVGRKKDNTSLRDNPR